MEFLEFQLFEPITFRLYSLSASSTGSSLLTWIAVLAAAAVGFWRIKTVGSRTNGSDTDSSTLFTTPSEEAQKKVVPVGTQNIENKTLVSPSCSFNKSSEIVGTPKERFTTYFEKEDCIGCCHVNEEEEEPTVDDIDEDFGQREVKLPRERKEMEVNWESIVVRRRGDLGWYSYQDMAALNGSVVRLWDGDSPRRRKGSTAISTF